MTGARFTNGSRVVGAAALLSLGALGLAACGNSGAGGTAASTSTPGSSSTVASPSGTAPDGFPAADAAAFDTTSAAIFPGATLADREAHARAVCASIARTGGDVVTWLKRTKEESATLVDFQIQPLQLQNLAGLAMRNYCREYLPALQQGLQGEMVNGQIGTATPK